MKNNTIQKTFIVGSEWLYYKIYCGVKTADTLLLEVIKPLSEELLKQKLIDKWFFIRYSDPEPHLRVRFHVIDVSKLGEIIFKVKEKIQPYIVSKQIWNIQLDTYQRELERYGKNTIQESETFFYNDSKAVISIIENAQDQEERFLQVFKRLETIIELFNLDDEIRLSFLDKMQHNFKEEFSADKIMKKELSKKYRELEPKLFDSFTVKEDAVTQILQLNKYGKITVSLESLLASFIHMTINRSFGSKQRMYEMMIYDFLYRKNKSIFVRHGKL